MNAYLGLGGVISPRIYLYFFEFSRLLRIYILFIQSNFYIRVWGGPSKSKNI
jgi:hypothetical protein